MFDIKQNVKCIEKPLENVTSQGFISINGCGKGQPHLLTSSSICLPIEGSCCHVPISNKIYFLFLLDFS